MTAAETDLCRRLEDCRRTPLGAIAMNSSAPTLRAMELENQKLRAEVSDLAASLAIVVERLREKDETGAYVVAFDQAAKHGAI